MAARIAVVTFPDRLAPPFEPDLAEKFLADHLGRLGDLQIEGVKRIERRAPRRLRELGDEIPVRVMRADFALAIGRVVTWFGHRFQYTPAALPECDEFLRPPLSGAPFGTKLMVRRCIFGDRLSHQF